jgi:hypothetical protein
MAAQFTLEWPLLPNAGVKVAPSNVEQPPVTLQQLQQAAAALAFCDATSFAAAAWLLVLLLQRADPGLRASFLGGPAGSSLCATCVARAYHSVTQPGSDARGGEWWLHAYTSPAAAAGSMMSALHGRFVEQPVLLSRSFTTALLLAWCYLQPPQQWQQQQPARQQKQDGAKPGYQLLITPTHVVQQVQQPVCTAPGG